MAKRRLVTIFADASCAPDGGPAGWGCWIKDDALEHSIIRGGAFKLPVESVVHAELAALANAVFIWSRIVQDTRAIVMLQSDCLNALACIRKELKAIDTPGKGNIKSHPVPIRRTPVPKGCKQPIGMLRSINDAVYIVRHVKGHTKRTEGRYWVNRRCDQLAKEGRQKALKALSNVVPLRKSVG